jgi:hypothetical protein
MKNIKNKKDDNKLAYLLFLSMQRKNQVLPGIDTMSSGAYDFGIDFVLQRPCTSSHDNGCNGHFNIGLDGIQLIMF